MAEYSRIAKGHFTSTGAAQVINLPFQPDFVELWNYTASITPAQHGVPYASWDNTTTVTISNIVYNPSIIEVFNATPVVTTDYVRSNGISTFAAGQLLQYGARQQVVASTKGTTTSFQVTGHGYAVGDTVIFEGLYQSATTGMPQMCGPECQFTITTITDANNFIVNWNSNNSSYTNLSASPSGAFVKKVLYPFIYVPQASVITAITTGTTTTIQTADYHNLRTGQEVAFRIPANWGTTQLNSLPNTLTPGAPVYGIVQSITDNWTFVVNINSTSYTAFTTAVAVTSVSGLSFPQVVAIGDLNTGGDAYNGGALYPSSSFPTSSGGVPTINGPSIRGAFANNTAQGFIIGAGGAVGDSSATLVGASGNVIYWRAYLSDIAVS